MSINIMSSSEKMVQGISRYYIEKGAHSIGFIISLVLDHLKCSSLFNLY